MKFIDSVCVLALVACFAGKCACVSSGTSVTSSTAFPYEAAVLCPVIMCNGAIVSSNNVVTTASCINNLTPADVQVYVGSNKYYSGGTTHDVTNIVTNNYNPSNYDNNIAVLTVAVSFVFSSTVIAIPLAVQLPPTNSLLTVTGYGATNAQLALPDVLQRAMLTLFSRTTCQQYKNNRLTPSMFCAGDTAGRKDLCPADQGSPLTYQNQLVGIYSWGCSCGLATPYPSSPVFTSIIYHRAWIQSNIQ